MGLGNTKMLSFKELLAVDYSGTGDPQLAKNAKRRKNENVDITASFDVDDEGFNIAEHLDPEDKFDMELKDLLGLDEAVLSAAQRARKKQLLRRSKAKIQIGRLIASRRMANKQTIQKRAKRRARSMIMKKILKGKKKGDLSYAARGSFEKILSKRKGGIERITKRITPKVRQDAVLRLRSKKAK